MRRLILVSQPRSGTNWHQDLAANAPNLLALRELFASKGVFGLNAAGGAGLTRLRQVLGRPQLDERDADATAWARSDPAATLAFFEETARDLGHDAIAFTLFSGQLGDGDLHRLLQHRQTRVVLLLRRHLPRYVSEVKAQALDRWKQVDTTALRPEVDADAFVEGMEEGEAWLSSIAAAAPVRVLRYEDDLLKPPEVAFAALRRATPWLARPGSPISTVVTVQDRGGDPFDRIANGPALREELSRRGLLDRALGYPDIGGSTISKSGDQPRRIEFSRRAS